jgi:hypothetical protein
VHLDSWPHSFDAFQQNSVAFAVIQHFSEHYRKLIVIIGISLLLGISLLHIETAFALSRGATVHQALLEYRLKCLYDLIGLDPS